MSIQHKATLAAKLKEPMSFGRIGGVFISAEEVLRRLENIKNAPVAEYREDELREMRRLLNDKHL